MKIISKQTARKTLAAMLALVTLSSAAVTNARAYEESGDDSAELPAIWADGDPTAASADENAIDAIKWFARSDLGKQVGKTGHTKQTEYFLFLPTTADLSELTVWHTFDEDPTINGKPLKSGEKTDIFAQGGEYTVLADDREIKLTVLQSTSIGSIYINTKSGSMANVHGQKTVKEEGDILVVEADGTHDYSGDLAYIKGRGNTTWNFNKRPYNIKLDKKASLLGMDVSKKWCLLANAQDHSLVRNKAAYDLGDEIGLTYSPDSQFADLYLNGEYAGVYQLTEKVEEGKNNLVKINDLTDATEKANGGTDLDSFTQVKDGSENGSKKYYDIPNDPEDITGGYLLEFDFPENYNEEKSGFVTKRGQYIVVKGPENATKKQIEYISSFCQEMEDAIYSSDGKNEAGKHYSEYIDTESAALMYLIQEYSLNVDAGMTSCFFYKDSDAKGDGKLHAGPTWDFDVAFGNLDSQLDDGKKLNSPDAIYASERYNWVMGELNIFGQLLTHRDFFKTMTTLFNERFKPALDILNSEEAVTSDYLKSLTQYRAELAPSAQMNFARWRIADNLLVSAAGKKFDTQYDYLCSFTAQRAAFLDEYLNNRTVSDEFIIYYYNDNGWDDVYAYIHNVDNEPEWPGIKMEKLPIELFDDKVMRLDLGALGYKDDGFVRAIFNDGKDKKAEDTKIANKTVADYVIYRFPDQNGEEQVYEYTYTQPFDENRIIPVSYIVGDVDGDGTVTTSDALTVLRISLGVQSVESEKQYLSTMIDGDDAITSADALSILRYSAGVEEETEHKIGETKTVYSYDYEDE